MVNNLKNIFFNLDIKDRGIFILLSLFPISIVLGNLVINSFIFLISISFFINLEENKKFFKDKNFYLLLFFFISLVINILFSVAFFQDQLAGL